MKLLRFALILIFVLVLAYCVTGYTEKIADTENAFYKQDFDTAVNNIRTLAEGSNNADKLLYLMEAGTILHTKGDYEKSNIAFKQAEQIGDSIKASLTKDSLAFLLSDNESNFTGESFERVIVKLYIAINYIMLNDVEMGKRYLRRVDYELRDMKTSDAKYKQNLFARYLDAIVSEYLKAYNDARVDYKNILEMDPANNDMIADRYVLAMKEGDSGDMRKYEYGRGSIQAFDNKLTPIGYSENLGELIIINQGGKAAIKMSRGKLMDEPYFRSALEAAIRAASNMKSNMGLSTASVMAMISNAENPIPEYKRRDKEGEVPLDILINGKRVSKTRVMNDYSDTAIANFNDNYKAIITRNVSSVATKVIAAAAAAYAAGELAKRDNKGGDDLISGLVSFAAGAIAGAGVSQTIKPDLRCWHMLPSNFQAKRIYLAPGTYTITFSGSARPVGNATYKDIVIEKGKPVFINLRSL